MQAYASTIEKKHKKVKLTAEKFSKDLVTTRRYLNMSFDEIKALDNPKVLKKRAKQVGAADYLNIIYKMLRDGYKLEIIYWYVMKKGFAGTRKQLEHAIDNIAKNNFNITFGKLRINYVYKKDSIVISRSELLKEITAKKAKYKHNKPIQDNLLLIEERYPIVKEVKEIFDDFYSTIMGNNPDKLDEFIKKYETKKEKDEKGNEIIIYYSPISPFIIGLKKDTTPVKNAISFSESSGFVEGNNNKFKLIKRILYGRSNLVNLFRKCYLCFSFKKTNFSLKSSYSLL